MVSSDYQENKCSFCGRTTSEVGKLLEGSGAFICNECIAFGTKFLENEALEKKIGSCSFKPIEIKNFLDDYVIGQEQVKKSLAVAVYNHYKRIRNITTEIQKSNIMLIGPTGSGKAQPLYSQIKTPDGWIKMGDIKVGDVVSTPKGKSASVRGVFPQGLRPTYRITFEDGRTTDCDENHLWKVFSYNWTRKHRNNHKEHIKVENSERIMSLKEIIEYKKKVKSPLYVPLCKFIQNSLKDLPMNPYLLGLLLGDGNLTGVVNFSNIEDQILNNLISKLEQGYYLKFKRSCDYNITHGKKENSNVYIEILRDLGLYDKHSYEKFIPEIYKESSVEQRLELLRGLMDIDGEVNKRKCQKSKYEDSYASGDVSYSTSNHQLALDVQYLIRSLGGLCTIRIKKSFYKTKEGIRKRCRMWFKCCIRHSNPEILMKLGRKSERAIRSIPITLRCKIKTIKYLGIQETQCIMIDHPDHLYITDGFVVTHNTLLCQTLARFLNVPFAIVDATSMTEAGYVGEDIETMLQTLLINANSDIEKATRGIIYIDEIDKKARKNGANPSITRDVSGEGVQQALLKLLEGSIINVQPTGQRKHPGQQYVRIDTRNILFILGGAFNGLAELIAERQGNSNVGFLTEKVSSSDKVEKYLKQVTHRDLIKYGLIPELVGRVPIIVTLDELDIDDLIKILTIPKYSLVEQYQELLLMDNIDLKFDKSALEYIAQKALDMGTGARSLRSIMESIMLETMFETPSLENVKECVVLLENGHIKVVRR
jgi:ATP-dependent Clp protease ATP-binding subunit ClpX